MLFKSVAVFATFALGASNAFASPVADNALKARDTPPGVAKIYSDTTAALSPLTQQLGTFVVVVIQCAAVLELM